MAQPICYHDTAHVTKALITFQNLRDKRFPMVLLGGWAMARVASRGGAAASVCLFLPCVLLDDWAPCC